MKITIISGSHRKDSQSLKVANFIRKTLDNGICDKTALIDLGGNPLPLWDQGVWDGEEKWKTLLAPLREELATSDAFVVVTPEWHGQVPAGLKNFFLLFSKNELGHKPAMITSVSSGDGGSYPIAELRMSSYKNNRLCYIPEHIIVRHVEQVLNDDKSKNDPESDRFYQQRIGWTLNILKEYASALTHVRRSGATDTDKFNNGM